MAHEAINVKEAEELYKILGSWSEVAKVLRRADGRPYQSYSIQAAVCDSRRSRPIVADRSSFVDPPFAPPPECVLRLPPPPSVNRTRKLNKSALRLLASWHELADKEILAAGGMRKFPRIAGPFEAKLILDENLNRLDLDNAAKAVIDYARRIGVIIDDGPKYMRRVTIEWGHAPHGCRLILRSVAADA